MPSFTSFPDTCGVVATSATVWSAEEPGLVLSATHTVTIFERCDHQSAGVSAGEPSADADIGEHWKEKESERRESSEEA